MTRFARLLVVVVACGCGGSEGSPKGGDGGSPPNGDAGTPSLGSVERMCLMNNACGFQSIARVPADLCTARILDEASANSWTTSPENRLYVERMISCAATETTCTAYVDCVRFGATCSGTVAGSCQGTVADRCSTPGGGHLPPIFDCALVGMSCEANGTATCVLPSGTNDCADATAERCDGNNRMLCRPRSGGGFGEYAEACPAGTTCIDMAGNTACMPPVASCAAQSAQCIGEVATYCLPLGSSLMTMQYDCGSVGRVCATQGNNVRCVPASTQCAVGSQGTTTSVCDGAGTGFDVCIEGVSRHVDCASVGRTTCATLPAISGLQPATAYCQ